MGMGIHHGHSWAWAWAWAFIIHLLFFVFGFTITMAFANLLRKSLYTRSKPTLILEGYVKRELKRFLKKSLEFECAS